MFHICITFTLYMYMYNLFANTQYCWQNFEAFKFHLTVDCNTVVRLGQPDFHIKPLNAELNPICHLLILLGNLTFMGPCIVSIFQYISNKMQRYTVYLYLETALHV